MKKEAESKEDRL